MTENEAKTVLEIEIEHHPEYSVFGKALSRAIKALEEIQVYRAIGTVEELQKAKKQYDDINSVAEKMDLIGLCDFGTAKEALTTEMKRSLDCSLKEYQSIGTVEEFKALKEHIQAMEEAYKNTDGYKDGYAKAITEFVARMKDSLIHNYRHLLEVDTDGFEWLTTDAVGTHIDEIAEEMRCAE